MLDKVINIVKEASKIMLDDHSFDVKEKGGLTNIVTTNDVKVQLFLQEKLKELIPDCSFYCEEGDIKDLSKDYIWIVDPIDGTANYSRHISVCAISVALEYQNKIILGVVYNPYQDMLFSASLGKGAYLNNKKIHVSNKKFSESILYTAFSAYDKTMSKTTFKFAQRIFPYINDIRRTGSAAFELCEMACARGDMFLEVKLNPWDYAAASLIIQEAHGYISGIEPFKLVLDGPSLICAANSKSNYKRLLKYASKYFK